MHATITIVNEVHGKASRFRVPNLRRRDPEGKEFGTPRVSLTLIVRDEEAKKLPHCLNSVRQIFDETVVVDTGSTDRTREIAHEYRGEGL